MAKIFEQIQNIKDRVKALLIQYPHLRDDDMRLIGIYYYYESGGKEFFDTATALTFLRMFSEGKLTHPESIRRVRAKLQEEIPALRGKSYKKRKDEGEDFSRNINK